MLLAEKQTELGKVVKEMRELNDAHKGVAMPADVDEKYNKLDARSTELEVEIRKIQDAEKRSAKLAEREAFLNTAPPPATKPAPNGHREDPAHASEHPYARHFSARNAAFSSPEYRAAFAMAMEGDYAGANKRAETLQSGVFTKGGALQPPTEWLAELLMNVDDSTFIRTYARKFRLAQAASLGVPKLDTDIDDADWTSELLTGSLGDFAFGTRELRPHPMAKNVKVSKTLGRVSAIPIEQFVRERLEYKLRLTDEKAFLTGNGSQKPLGIFTASANGISTGRDVSTDNTQTAITMKRDVATSRVKKTEAINTMVPAVLASATRPSSSQARRACVL